MKTNVFFPRTVFFFALVGFLSVFIFSCGSFQNSSYYDRDGIYGSGNDTNQPTSQPSNQDSNQATAYANYFGSLQDPEQSTETFTDVERYSSISDSLTPQYSTQYTSEYTGSQGAWGSNATTTNFNFYNTNWGMNNYWYNSYWNDPFLFWGWDYWYSPYNMGWGFQPYMNYFGGFYPYYFYNYNPYVPQWYYGNAYYHEKFRPAPTATTRQEIPSDLIQTQGIILPIQEIRCVIQKRVHEIIPIHDSVIRTQT